MELFLFRVRVAPLCPPDSLQALRCVSTAWQTTVDQLISVKGALGLRAKDKWTPADVRFAHAYVERVALSTALAACASGELQDLQWGLATFLPSGDQRLFGAQLLILWMIVGRRVTRQECMALLIREHGMPANLALSSSCEMGRLELAQWLAATFGLDARNRHLAVAQWLTTTFGLTAKDARSMNNSALRFSCENGHLAMAQWLVSTFGLTAADARCDGNFALRFSSMNGHLAVVQWLVSTFGLTTADARCEDNFAFQGSCDNGHLAVAQWLADTFGLTAKDAGPDYRSLPPEVVRWLEARHRS
jgi:hypothetical protein